MKMLILRGVHDSTMVPEIVAQIRRAKANVVFVEMISSSEYKNSFAYLSQRLAHEPEFAESEYAPQVRDSPEAFLQIMWSLRGQGIIVLPVDKTVDDGKQVEALLLSVSYVPDGALDDYVQDRDLIKLYRAAATQIRATIKEVKARDRLVASQVHHSLQEMAKKHVKADSVVIVQGLFHYSKPWLQHLLPDADIEEASYNQKRVDWLFEMSTTQLIFSLLRDPQAKIPRGRLARLLYVEVFMRLTDSSDPTLLTTIKNDNDERLKDIEYQCEQEIKTLSDSEVESGLVKLLERFASK